MYKLTALVKYQIHYYINSAKYLPPLVLFVLFVGINYQMGPFGIWSNLYITAMALFVFSSWVAMTFAHCEDKTQQHITAGHLQQEAMYYLSKTLSVLLLLVPFYLMLLLIPTVTGTFIRPILASEMAVYLLVYFLTSLLGASLGMIFNDSLMTKEFAQLALLLVVCVAVVPFNIVYSHIPWVVTLYYLVPSINFLANRLDDLGDEAFLLDWHFLLFVLYMVGYSLVLTGVFVFAMPRGRRK